MGDGRNPQRGEQPAVVRGFAGTFQINGHSDKPMHLNTDDDLYRLYNHSLWLDLRILLMTPIAALRVRGAFRPGRGATHGPF